LIDMIASTTKAMMAVRSRPPRASGCTAERVGQPFTTDAQLVARDPEHPADLEGREPPERGARVEVCAAGALEPAARLGEVERDEEREKRHERNRDPAPTPDVGRQSCRQQEYPTADHLVDTDAGEVPFAERAFERRPRRFCGHVPRQVIIEFAKIANAQTRVRGSWSGSWFTKGWRWPAFLAIK
jgi:hypothetical protein